MSSTRKESILGKRRDDCRPTQGGGWPAGILAIAALAAGSRAQSTAPDWSWFVLAQGIGNGQLTVSANAGVQELIVPCGASGFTSGSRYWMILRHDVGANNFQQRFVSPLYPVSNPIVKMLAGDLLATPGQEIVVALRNGDVEVWSQASRQLQVSFSNNLTNTQGACLGDVDGDGDLDIIVVSPGGVRARDNAGQLLLLRDDLHGSDVAAGQFDGDPALEIACSDGQVFDCGTQSVQATWQNGFAGDLDSADIDGDGMLELVQADPVGFVWAHDVDVMIPKFSRPVAGAHSVTIGNIDADANLEIGVGTPQPTAVTAFDAVTQALDFTVANPDYGVTTLVFGDLDGDGQIEVAWGAGFVTTGPDILHIAGVPNRAIEWSSPDVGGPVVGPEFGDVDGDGNVEMVVIANRGGFSPARLLFFDPVTFRQEFLSPPLSTPVFSSSVTDLSLADVNGDSDMELVVCNGSCTVYDYGAGQLTNLWQVQSGTFPNPTYQFADVVDLDGNGTKEVVAAGIYAHVFQYGSTAEVWRSFYLGGTVLQAEVAQTDADSGLEVFALSSDGNIYVFDGATRTAQFVIQDQGVDRSSFAFLPTNIPGYQLPYPSLVVGDEAGKVSFLINTGNDFTAIGPFPTGAGTSAIDGIHWIGNTSLFAFGQGSRVHIHDLFTPLWTSQDRGTGFGARIRVDLPNLTLTAVGSLGVSHFQF